MAILLLLHIVSALLLGAYLVVPFTLGRVAELTAEGRNGFASVLTGFVRTSHYALLALIITGVFLFLKVTPRPPDAWAGAAIVLLLLLGALIGVFGKQVRTLTTAGPASPASEQGTPAVAGAANVAAVVRRMRTFGWFIALVVVLAIIVMVNPSMF